MERSDGTGQAPPATAGTGGDYVRVEQPRAGVTLVVLDRPERMNAMAFDVMAPLREALEEVGRDPDTEVVVLTGAGRGFCSGADLEHPGTVPDVDGLTVPAIARRAMELLEQVATALVELHQPVIAAVNGPAVGGGFCLALAADIRIAAESAFFRAAGIGNGLTAAELGLSYLLPRAVGSSRAAEIMLSGRDVGADEAERMGLVSRVVAPGDLLDACYDLADTIIGHSQLGTELTKRLLWGGLEAGSLRQHMRREGLAQLYVRLLTGNFEEAIAARDEGRPPVFRD